MPEPSAWVRIQASQTLLSCVTLSNLPNLSVLQLPNV